MINTNGLQRKMNDVGVSASYIACILGLKEIDLDKIMNQERELTIKQATTMAKELKLNLHEVNSLFFA